MVSGKDWRTLALFVGAIGALAFISPKAAMLAAGTVFLVILFRNVPTSGGATAGAAAGAP
jgi:hypothetical protein